ncbi:YhgE/Pip family protein [Saccharopolyspora hordei]|uniref:Putative membrane protein n=1 Tax=Saccharopolyspora hordei TaxID=1838 RepID=A0A853AVC0_9PSEU|nr:YhgE/Pip family protein [Saccharopolyspora hordei]NYI86643.1 putative membrane protein [Saccharopolyspora hordei]
MRNPFTQAARRSGGSVGRGTWIGLALVPVLLVGVLAWAFWAPMSQHGAAEVAVVNEDEPATINGQMAPLGREMAAKLVNSTDTGYTWQVTAAEDAREGLADGRYAAVVTIPKAFSRTTASVLTGEPMDATQAGIRVETSPVAAPADAAAVEAAARQSVSVFNKQIVEMLLDGFYGGFAEMHGQLGTAVDGARQLADGSGQLAGGIGQLSSGVDELASGVPQLADGGNQLADGMQQLSGGLNELHRQVKQMPEQTRQLADGAEQVAAGNRAMADQFVPLTDQILAATELIPDSPKLDGLAKLAERCPTEGLTSDFCTQLREHVEQANQRQGVLDTIKAKIQGPVKQARDGFEGLAFGSEQIAMGTRMLADNSGQLVDGIGQLAAGGTQLSDGAQQLAGGLDQLNGGVQQLHGGVGQLADGAQQVADGNRMFADQMAPAADQLPNYTDEERAHLKTVASSPAALESELPTFGKSLIGLLIAVAFWIAGLAVYAVVRAVPEDAATSRRSSWRLVLTSLLPGALVAAVGAVVVSAALAPFLDLSFGSWAAFAGVTLLAALAFVAVNQALTALFGTGGRVVSLVVLALAAATGVVSTVPGLLHSTSSFLPTHGAVQALASIVTGADGALSGVLQLLVWLVAGVLFALLAVDRARVVPAKRFRRQTAASRPAW